MEFGERLAKLIDEKGITAYKLSKETGITQSTLSEVLNAKNKTLSTPNTIKIANCLGVSTDYLLGKSPFKTTSEAKYSIIVAAMKMILNSEYPTGIKYDNLVWNSAIEVAELLYEDKDLTFIKSLRAKKYLTNIEYYQLAKFVSQTISWPDDYKGPVRINVQGETISCPVDYWNIPEIRFFEYQFDEPVFEFTTVKESATPYNVNSSQAVDLDTKYLYRIPLVGRIAAGDPILAIENSDEQIIIDTRINKVNGTDINEFFALEVVGQSMEPTIHDGEFVLVRRQPEVEIGQIGVFMCNEEEATIKRFAREMGKVYLIPDNKQFPIQEYTANCICIGKVIESIRRVIK